MNNHNVQDLSQGKSTALHKACAKGGEDQVRTLLGTVENIKAQDPDFMTPLQVTARKNKSNFACILIEQKANVRVHALT